MCGMLRQPPLADVSGAATNDGAQIIQWTADGGTSSRGFESFTGLRSSFVASHRHVSLDTTSRPRLSSFRTCST